MEKEKVKQDFEQFMQEICQHLPHPPSVKFEGTFIENLLMRAQSARDGVSRAKWLAEKANEWYDDYQNKHGVLDEEIAEYLREHLRPILRWQFEIHN